MNWFVHFLTSSIGRKVIMSLTGLFLISFLLIHLIGNLQLLYDDGGQQFNLYAKFMTTNPVIKTVSYLLYASILLHAIQGVFLWRQNVAARGKQRYAVSTGANSSFASRSMGWLGVIIFVFLLIHMYQFWFKMKIGALEFVEYEGVEVKNLYEPVALAFSNPFFVIFYVASMIVIALHLYHGFQSAFQTLGLNHRKYTPLIKSLGAIFSVLVPLGFAIIPIFFFLMR
ncbi:MAG: succinate dehydrogenase cytochrome b subunit [Bacteroidota bacterium]